MYRAVDTVVDRREALKKDAVAVAESGDTVAAAPVPIDLRTAALVVAIERLALITLQRGIWP